MLIYLIILSPLFALGLDALIPARRHVVLSVVLVVCALIPLAPLVFTEYNYGCINADGVVITVSLTILLFAWMRWLRWKAKRNLAMLAMAICFFPVVALAMWEGDREIEQQVTVGKFTIRRTRRTGLVDRGSSEYFLYETRMNQVFWKLRSSAYQRADQDDCIISFVLRTGSDTLRYNSCTNTILSL